MVEKDAQENKRINDFLADYNKLVEKHKLQLVAHPGWIRNRDGTWSLVCDLKIGGFDDSKS